jgi:defect-in-organelle-trafficking protein DotB
MSEQPFFKFSPSVRSKEEVIEFFYFAYEANASDIRISTLDYPWGLVRRKWVKLGSRPLNSGEVSFILRTLHSESVEAQLNNRTPISWRPSVSRSRDDVIYFRGEAGLSLVAGETGCSAVFRRIPGLPPSLEDIKIFPVGATRRLYEGLFPDNGLVIVTGVTGSGKSTTLAAMVRERLMVFKSGAIGTFEDPIEYVYGHELSNGLVPAVTQMGIDVHVSNWGQANKTAMRRKFDVMILGEVRDSASGEATLEAAMTGHAVYATMHVETPDLVIPRLVDLFPHNARQTVASNLIDVSKLFVSQKIVVRADGLPAAYRSWCLITQKLRRQLRRADQRDLGEIIRAEMLREGTDFLAQSLPDYQSGVISKEVFSSVVGVDVDEVDDLVAERLDFLK